MEEKIEALLVDYLVILVVVWPCLALKYGPGPCLTIDQSQRS